MAERVLDFWGFVKKIWKKIAKNMNCIGHGISRKLESHLSSKGKYVVKIKRMVFLQDRLEFAEIHETLKNCTASITYVKEGPGLNLK